MVNDFDSFVLFLSLSMVAWVFLAALFLMIWAITRGNK
jgi:hypothetical protein